MLNYAALLPLSLFHIFSIGSRQLFKHKLDVKCSHSRLRIFQWERKISPHSLSTSHSCHVLCHWIQSFISILPLFNVHEAFCLVFAITCTSMCGLIRHGTLLSWRNSLFRSWRAWEHFCRWGKILFKSFHKWMRAADVQMEFNTKKKSSKENDYVLMNSSFLRIFMLVNFDNVCVQHRVTLQFLQLYRDVPLSHRSILSPSHNTRHTELEWLCGSAGNTEKVNDDRKRCDNGEGETASRKRYEQNLVIFNLISLL